jgi:hypothetical protein
MLDDLFGKPVQQKPGALDVGLTVAGLGLILAGVLRLGTGAEVGGAACLILGLSIPLNNLWQAGKHRRSARRIDLTLKQGVPLNLHDAATQRLVSAYTQIQRLPTDADPINERALEVAHGALLEVGNLLKGRAPQGAAEVEYVSRRAEAVQKLARSLTQHAAAQERRGEAKAGAARGAAVEAISDFETRTGLSSLTQLENLQSVIDQGAGDGHR